LEAGQHLAGRLAELGIGQFLFSLDLHLGDRLTHGGIGGLMFHLAGIVRESLTLMAVQVADLLQPGQRPGF
jgi:hypothetical protein